MPENNVIISIRSQQSFQDQEDQEPIELVTEGLLRQESGAYTLSYQESEVTGLGGTLTTIQVEPGCVTLMRMGEVNSQMVFQEGRRHLSLYETPYGGLEVGINTRRLRSSLGEAGGRIEIDYNIEIDHQVAGMTLFQIDVREKKRKSLLQ